MRWTNSILWLTAFLCLTAPNLAGAQQEVFYLEDWDTTPEVPDALRGWRDGTLAQGYLAFEEGRGNYLRNNFFEGIPFFFSTFDSSGWLSNAYVGDKNYRELEMSLVEFEARYDETIGFSNPFTYISLILMSETEVELPGSGGTTIRPAIWTHSNNFIELDQGWETFSMEIPFDATSSPVGWHVFPESDENWNLVMQDVDAIRVCFCEYFPGIGGVFASWNAGLDNFTVYQGDPIGAQPVPALDRNGIIALIALFGLLATGWWLRHRPSRQAPHQ